MVSDINTNWAQSSGLQDLQLVEFTEALPASDFSVPVKIGSAEAKERHSYIV